MRRSKFVFQETARCQDLEVEKKPGGQVDKISSTCLLARVGAFGPALRTGAQGPPVIGSRMLRAFFERILRGLSTMRPPSTRASSGSPGPSPRVLRMRPE